MLNEDVLKERLWEFQQTMDHFTEIISVITVEMLTRSEADIRGAIDLLDALIDRADRLNNKFAREAKNLSAGAEFGHGGEGDEE